MNPVGVNRCVCEIFNDNRRCHQSITFDEVTLADRPANVHPNNVSLETYITKNIKLKGCGIVSAAMDTVTEKELALALAKMGGLGIIHRNMSAKEQAKMIRWVRKKINYVGMIETPICYKETQYLANVQKDITDNEWTFTSFPIINESGELTGLLTRDETAFVENNNPQLKDIMIIADKLITTQSTDNKEAYQRMKAHKVKKMPVIDNNNKLIGMYVWNDLKKDIVKENNFSLDSDGHFLVGAAIGVGTREYYRAKILIEAGCKVIVIDTSHGACTPVVQMIEYLKEKYSIDVIAGNIASAESALYLLVDPVTNKIRKYLPDAIKVGISIGSICTTRLVTGHGMPQLTAIYEVWKMISTFGLKIPIIADGGIRYPGDIVKALAVGASGVMMGGVFGGTAESPGTLVIKDGVKYKHVRGMGARSALEERNGSRMRYLNSTGMNTETDTNVLTTEQKQKVVPEGIEGLTKYRGTVEDVMTNFLGGVRLGLAHSGAANIDQFRDNVIMWKQSTAGIIEGKPHDLEHIRE